MEALQITSFKMMEFFLKDWKMQWKVHVDKLEKVS